MADGGWRMAERKMHVMAVSTIEILARRKLECSCGQECVDWAIGMLERGFESRSLLMLAGMTPPLHHFEIRDLRDRALEEMGLPERHIEDPVTAYVVAMVSAALADVGALREVFATVARIAIETGYPNELMPFYLLHFAAEDLRHQDTQWYWPEANRTNIYRIMREEAERFVAKYET
jgi:hypothetical protein